MDFRMLNEGLKLIEEASLKLHLITIRDRLSRGLVRSISWCDTRDMVADALTKGGIDRKLLLEVMAGRLTLRHEVKTHWGIGKPCVPISVPSAGSGKTKSLGD